MSSSFEGKKVTSLFDSDPKVRGIYEEIFGGVLITAKDVEVALAAGNVLPHGLLEAVSARLEISVDVDSFLAEQG